MSTLAGSRGQAFYFVAMTMKKPDYLSALSIALVTGLTLGIGACSSSSSTSTTGTANNAVPFLGSLVPANAAAGAGALTLTLQGTGFIASSIVRWNGSARPTTYSGTTQLTAAIPATDLTTAGPQSVTVFTPGPGGGTSGALIFTVSAPAGNPLPSLTATSPSSAYAGAAAFTLTVTGTNFIASSVVRWNGQARTTTFVSATQLTAQIPATDIAAASTAQLTVFTPTPGGGTSSPLAYSVLTLAGITVYDAANNISWLADADLPASNRFGLPLCSGPGVQICINASGSMRYDAAVAWVAAMNAANYLGRNNWQLPTTPAIDNACGKKGPTGQSFGFGCVLSALATLYNGLGLKAPNTAVPIPTNSAGPFSNVQPYLYWSSTSAPPPAGENTFSFATGWVGANTLPNLLYVLPMVPGKIAGTPAPNGNALQVNPGGQTVYDPMTNVTWLANANLAATNAFGLPACTTPTTPTLCVAKDGAMSWDSASQLMANMNAASYLGQTHWQLPPLDQACTNYNCGGNLNPMGNLFYSQLGFTQGMQAVATPNITVGQFHNIQPYLYWSCMGATIQSACDSAGPVPNFEWSYSFGSGFEGTDLLMNDLYVTVYFVGPSVQSARSRSGSLVNDRP